MITHDPTLAGWRGRRADHLSRFAGLCLAILVVIEATWIATSAIRDAPFWSIGMDYRFYVELAHRWLADGTFYLPHQLSGPYSAGLLEQVSVPDNLYPPSALLLFVPFAFLPAVLWWIVPIAVMSYALYRLRPAPWAWIVMLLLLAWPRAIGSYLFGNTDMWVMAAVAGGLRWGWPALAVTLKPTFLPLALLGVRRRSWWFGAALGACLVALALPLWSEYVAAMWNLSIDPLYSLGSVPLMLIPIVAWLGGPDHGFKRAWRPSCLG